MTDLVERPDLAPGFWNHSETPTPLARAIQMPMFPADRWMNGVLNATIKRPAAIRALTDAAKGDRT